MGGERIKLFLEIPKVTAMIMYFAVIVSQLFEPENVRTQNSGRISL